MRISFLLVILFSLFIFSCGDSGGNDDGTHEIKNDCSDKICTSNSTCIMENEHPVCKCDSGYIEEGDFCLPPHHLFVTGETKTISENDDGYTQRGIQRAYKTDDKIIIDSNTGLYWQNNEDTNSQTWEEAKAYCENLNLGMNKWRLPDYYELLTLVDLKFTPTVNPVFSHISSDTYWTYNDTSISFYVDFENGDVNYSLKTEEHKVICVSGEFKYSKPALIKNENDTYYDESTGLMWIENAEKKNWADSLDYCENLDSEGYTDWHLPNINELYTLLQSSVGVGADLPVFWSSTISFSDNKARVFEVSGKSYSEETNKSLKFICVRSDNFASYEKGKWGDIILNDRYTIPSGAVFIDIRTEAERNSGWPENSVGGAIYSSSDTDKFVSDVSAIVNNDKSKHIILTCASSGRSGHAVEILANAGFTYTEHIIGGTNKWKSYNLPWVTE